MGCFYVTGILSWKCGWGWDCTWVWFEAEVEVGLSLGWGWSLVKVELRLISVEVILRALMGYFWSLGRVQNCFGVYLYSLKL